MIIQTRNSQYQLSGLGSKFEVRKLSGNPAALPMQPIEGDKFELRVGEHFRFFNKGKEMLNTSTVTNVLG